MRMVIVLASCVGACAAQPQAPAVTGFTVERPAPDPAPRVVYVQRHVDPVVPLREADEALNDAEMNVASADRYVGWQNSKPHIVDRLTPLVTAVSRAAKRVSADKRRHRVSIQDDVQLRAATASLSNYLATKGD